MKIYNTLSRKKEELDVKIKRNINFFVCGPTVYDYIHIGNARTYIVFDIVIKYLRSIGFKVFYLQNITDIDDKIIKRSKETNLDIKNLSLKFEKAYHADEKSLGINSVTKYARATTHIKEIVNQIKILIQKGYAYKIEDDGYYFDIKKFTEYGKLSRRTALQAEDSVSRIDESVRKNNKGDFVLWKFSKDGEPFWKTPLGNGRPGWHIEDTAITEKYFGPQYDVHGAAIDLIFPHHEAELAQQESASGKKPFVKIWMHSGFLNFKGEKMSKSSGDFMTVRDFLKKYDSNILRLIVANHHYRSPVDYSEILISQTLSEWMSILQFIAKLEIKRNRIYKKNPANDFKVGEDVSESKKLFNESMRDDFNVPSALASIHALMNKYQKTVFSLNTIQAKKLAKFIIEQLKLLGFTVILPKIPNKIRELAKKRELLRENKQFIQSDDLRKELNQLGYTVEDTPFGTFIWPN